MNQPTRSPERTEYDADVSVLLYKTGQAVKQFLIWLGRIFIRLGKALTVGLLFLMRNILWLVAGALVGLGYGYYKYNRQGTHYVASMTAKANFNSTRALYNTIDYVNSLIAAGGTTELSQLFGITTSEAGQLRQLSATHVESELITADMYKEQFMQYDRTIRIRQDTFWLRTIKYEDFKDKLTKFDYPYHEIEAVSVNASIFPKLEKGLVNYISQNELLQEVRKRQAVSNKDEERLLTEAISNIDTLRRAYNERLKKGQSATPGGGNQLTVVETTPDVKTPELDLYDKMLELHDELKKSRKRNSTEKDIIEIISSFNPVGRPLTFFKQYGIQDTITGLIVALAILLFIAAYKALVAFEKANRPRKTTNH